MDHVFPQYQDVFIKLYVHWQPIWSINQILNMAIAERTFFNKVFFQDCQENIKIQTLKPFCICSGIIFPLYEVSVIAFNVILNAIGRFCGEDNF